MLILTAFAIIEEFAKGVIEGIKNNIRNKQVTPFGSMHSTGHAENSLFYRIEGNTLIIGSSWAYITVLEDGRKPGKFAPPEVIEQWLEDKPIQSELSNKSLAFLINRSMSEKGSLLYRQGGHSGILSDFTNQDYIHKNLTEALQEQLVIEVSNILFKRAA